MQVTETLAEGLRRELNVVVPKGDLAAKVDARLNDMKSRAQIKGFRPGKVPVSYLRKLYGKSLMGEIVQETVNETSQKALEDRSETPAFQPDIKLTEDQAEIDTLLEGGSDLAYGMTYEIMPSFEAMDFSKLTLEKEVAEISDEDMDAAITRLAEQNREFEDKGKKKAADGDRVTIDYLGKLDGEPFEGGKDEDAKLVLGSNRFIPGFEEQLVGVKKGDEKVITVTFPADYGAENLKGKEATFDITVKGVEAPVAIEINDELASKLGMESLDNLKEAVRQQFQSDYDAASRRKLKRVLLDALDENHDFDLPPTLVEREFDAIWREVENDLKRQNKTFEDEDTTEEKARDEYRAIAERRVRLGLLLADVGSKADVQVSEQELQQALAQRVRQFPGQEQQVIQFYQQNPGAVAELRAPIFEDKTVDHILEMATLEEKTVSREELFTDPDDEHDHAHDHDHDHAHDHDHDHDH